MLFDDMVEEYDDEDDAIEAVSWQYLEGSGYKCCLDKTSFQFPSLVHFPPQNYTVL